MPLVAVVSGILAGPRRGNPPFVAANDVSSMWNMGKRGEEREDHQSGCQGSARTRG